jgi:hypothetical protein
MRERKLLECLFGDGTPASRLDIVEYDAVAHDIERLLGVELDDAKRIAMTCVARAAAIPHLGVRTKLPPPPALPPHNAAILALPFTTDAVRILRAIDRPMLIEKTSLTRALEPLFEGRAELVTSDVMVRRNREGGPRPLFITFPDHHLTGDGTTRTAPFLESDQHFSLLELLLLIRGAAPLYTMRIDNGELRFVEFTSPIDPATPTEADANAVVLWLARNLESVVRYAPERVLSWRAIALRTSAAMRVRRTMDARLLQALVRTANALPPDIRTHTIERLRAMEEGDAA